MNDTCHLYTDLAWRWPMWGDAATEYAHYCQHVTGLIRRHAKRPVTTLLDIGCGGGKNVLNLKREFDITGLDLSPVMLAQAKDLNPDCTFFQSLETLRRAYSNCWKCIWEDCGGRILVVVPTDKVRD